MRVLVADDLGSHREGVVGAVNQRPHLELVGEPSLGGDPLEAVRELQPDVTLLDVNTPGVDVVGLLERDELPTRVVILSARLDGETVYAAIEAGVKGYLSQESPPEQVCDAIVGVADGETVLAPELQLALAREIQQRSSQARALLTTREYEVLMLIKAGHSPYEVRRRLYLSEETLRGYVHGFCNKLEVTEVADAVTEGIRRGIIR